MDSGELLLQVVLEPNVTPRSNRRGRMVRYCSERETEALTANGEVVKFFG